ncbi:uncharacterized protein J5M81_013743 [Pluvialis apricaria]
MTNLRAEDSGTYSCASRSRNSRYIALRTISLNVFKGLQAQTPEAKERQSEGSTLHIHCPYTAQTDYYDQKAWCRVRDDACEPLVETTYPTRYTTEATKGNVKIVDKYNYMTVFITMTNLRAEDSGTYSCAYRSRNSGYIALRTISLNVFKELHKRELDGLSVQCPYSAPGYSTETKVWCRREGQSGCKVVVRTDYPSTRHTDYYDQKAWCRVRDDACEPLVETSDPTRYQYTTEATKGNVKIEDDSYYRTVFITMTNLQAEDSGTYSCAYRSRNSRYTALRTISLNVFKELHKRELDGLSVQCPYSAPGYSTETKVWCRREGQSGCKVVVRTDYASTGRNSKALEERALIQDDTQNRTVTITMQKLQAQENVTEMALVSTLTVESFTGNALWLLFASEAPNVFSSPSLTIPPNSTETTIGNEGEIKRHGLQMILWLVLGIVASKTLAIVILVLLTRSRKRNSTVKASRR